MCGGRFWAEEGGEGWVEKGLNDFRFTSCTGNSGM